MKLNLSCNLISATVIGLSLMTCDISLAQVNATSATRVLAPTKVNGAIRIATFNVSLNRSGPDKLTQQLQEVQQEQQDKQIWAVATVIRSVQPDIILLNEVDHSTTADNAKLFHDHFVNASHADLLGGKAHAMPFQFSAPVNTGQPSGKDLNRNQRTDDPEDAWGFGRFPGQYGMAVLSRFEIDQQATRTFQQLRWNSLPDARRPKLEDQPYYDDATWAELRLPSKSFWDVVIRLPNQRELHLLASHPTPPAFDGPEDRNGLRNHDEIRLLVEYLETEPKRDYDWDHVFRDDQGRTGCLAAGKLFAVAGDLNCDPIDGDSQTDAIRKLLAHPRVHRGAAPTSPGALQASAIQGRKNADHRGSAQQDTADFDDRSVGNLRVDYMLPSSQLKVLASGVVWPAIDADLPASAADVLKQLNDASDHHLVWVDLQLP